MFTNFYCIYNLFKTYPGILLANQASLLQPSAHKPITASTCISSASGHSSAGVAPTDNNPIPLPSSTSSGAGATQTKPSDAAGAKQPGAIIGKIPNARSRWKKLTGTAMFINRLGKPFRTCFLLHGDIYVLSVEF